MAHFQKRSGIKNSARHTAVARAAQRVVEMLESRVMLSETPYLLPQHQIVDLGSYLTEKSADAPLAIATDYLQEHAADLGVVADDVNHFSLTDEYTDPDTGTTHLYLRQTLNGLDIVNANLAVNVAADGRIINVGGAFVRDLAQLNVDEAPTIDAATAIIGSADDLDLHVTKPTQSISKPAGIRQNQLLQNAALSLDPIPAQLVYYATENGLSLAWSSVLRTADGEHWYDLNTDARTGEVLAAIDWVDHATYDVFPQPVESPQDGSRALVTDPHDPTASPFGWHDTNGAPGAEFTDTRGNNVSAQDDTDANNTGGSRPDGGASLNFDFPLDLTQAPSTYQPAAITNLYYWNNLLHDIHYKYGFTEAAGNFQINNYGKGGAGNDAVQADAQDGLGTNNANFATPADGSQPRMQMYVFTYTTPNRDGDLENGIITHEYGHGVSNRLTGGPANSSALSAIQSGGMGEGWSDWWAMMLTQRPTDVQDQAYPMGNYVLGQTSSGKGIRRQPYSYNMTIDPITLSAFNSSNEVHNAGEIWASALWDMTWLLINKYGYSSNLAGGYTAGGAGNLLALKLVMDALKLQPANPTFLNARDAIIQADTVLNGGADLQEIWTAFARRGMGLSAYVGTSANSTSVTAAFDLPVFGLSVTTTNPVVGSIVNAPPVDFTIDFNAAFVQATVEAGDFKVNGVAADSFAIIDADTVKFHFNTSPVTTQGQQTMSIAAAAMSKLSDNSASIAFSGTFRYDAVPMTVVSTNPANGSGVSLPLTAIDVTFNEPYAAASLGISDLTISQGIVTAASQVNSTTVRFTVSGITAEGTVTLSMAAGALTDAFGNPMNAYSGTFVTDLGTVPFPTPLTQKTPAGSLAYTGQTSSVIGPGDTDSFTLSLDPGQMLTLIVTPGASLLPTLTLRDGSNVTIATATAPGAGKPAVIQAAAIAGGTYTITVGSGSGTTGTATLQAWLNAAAEMEHYGAPTNDTLATAQNINSAFLSLGGGGDRAAILGSNASPNVTTSTIFSTDFESGIADWTIANTTSGLWHWSVGRGSQSGHSATHSLYYGTGETATGGGTYNNGVRNSGTVTSPSITLPSGGLSLDFNYVLQTENSTSWDYSYVQISTNGGSTYTNLATLNGTAESTTWRAATTINLSAYAGQTVKLRFFFDTLDSGANSYEGWYVDDVKITQTGLSSTDYYAFDLSTGDQTTLGIKGLTAGTMTLKLYDAAGALLAQGVTTASNLDSVIPNFVAPTTGVYYAQITGSAGNDYSFIATRNTAFDVETNDTIATGISMGGKRTAFGAVSAGSGNGVEPDDYSAGTVLTSIVPGISLSAVGSTSAITSQLGSYHSTGTRVFAYGTTTAFNSSGVMLRADFAGGALSASIDIVPNDSSDPGVLRAYNSAGTLLQEVTCAAPPLGGFTTITITRPTKDIAYITAGGLGGDNALLDHLVVGGAGLASDYYTVNLTTGQSIRLSTRTPSDGADEFVNTLDPTLDLYDASGNKVATNDNGAADGRNAVINYTATTAGTYAVRVYGAGNSTGEYVLSLGDAINVTLPANVSETAGIVNGTLTLTSPAASDLSISLVSSDPSRVTVSSPITILAGQTSAPFAISVLDNQLLDGPQAITISATAAGYGTSTATVNVQDDETAGLSVTLPANVAENAGTITGTVTATAAPTRDLIIQLSSNLTSRLTVPATVTLKAGETFATFSGTVVNNTVIDGTQTATVTASLANWTSGSAAVSIQDNDGTIAVTLPTTGFEGQTLANAGTVTLGGTSATPTVVTLISSDTTELSVPATVTVPAGQTSATFNVNLLTDALKDGSQTAFVIGSVIGLSDGLSGNIVVHDANLDHLTIDPIGSPKTVGVAFSATARAFNIANELITVNNSTFTLSATGSSGALAMTPASGAFASGVWTGNVAINAIDPVAILHVNAGGVLADSNSFATTAGAVASFQWGTIASPKQANQAFGATLTAKDANGYIATGYNGSATLSGAVGSSVSQAMLGNLAFTTSNNNGSYTVGYQFTPNTPIAVTHVRSYFGSKVSFWTNTGTLLASQAVSGAATTWTETPMATPITLAAGTTYRITVYTNAQLYYWRTSAPANPSFATLGATYEISGDAFPTNADPGQYWLVDLRGNVGTSAPVPITPTTATFTNGVWSGNVAVLQQALAMHLHVDDGAGHVADSNNFDVIDLNAPTGIDLLDAGDSGFSTTDNITNLNNSAGKSLQFSVAGTVAGATVTLYADGTAIGSAVATSASTLITTSEAFTLTDGAHSLTARQTIPGQSQSGDCPALAVTIDTLAPSAPVAPDLQTASDTGVLTTDNITSINTPAFTVTATPYFRFARNGVQLSGNFESGTAYTLASQPDGTAAYSVAAVDAAGNVSSYGVALNVTIDSVAPRIISSSVQSGASLLPVEEHASSTGEPSDEFAPGGFTYSVTFSEPMPSANLDSTDVTLLGVAKNVSYTPTSLAYSAGNTVLTVTYSTLPEDAYVLTLLSANGRFEDAAGNDLDGEANFPMPPNQSGNGVAGGNFVLNFSTDITTQAFPTPLTAKQPLGSLIYDPSVSGVIGVAGDTDSFTLALDAGQTLSLVATPGSTLRPTIELRNPSNVLIASVTASATGIAALLQTTTITTAGTYTITLSGAASTTGAYTVSAILNAAVEAEGNGGAANNSRATAQSIDASFISLGSNATRGAVLGKTDLTAGVGADYYAFTASAGDKIFLGYKGLSGSAIPGVTLQNSAGTAVATAVSGPTNLDKVVSSFTIPSTGTYYVFVDGLATVGDYSLLINRNTAFDTESNDTSSTAQNIDGVHNVLGSSSGSSGGTPLTLGAAYSGWWDSTGVHTSSNQNYITGFGSTTAKEYRDFFVFNLTGITQPITGAQLLITNPSNGYLSTDPTETLSLFDVSTPISTLEASGSAQTGIFDDLGTGNTYGSQTVSAADNGKVVTIALNPTAINALNGAVGNALALGGAITTISGTSGQFIFGYTTGGESRQLVLTFGTPVDWYSLNATAGVPLMISTNTPADGAGEFVNTLNPHVELYDSAGNLVASGATKADGRNELLQFQPATTGLYRVRVTAEGGTAGEYILNVNRAPKAANDSAATAEDNSITLSPTGNDTDGDADLLTITATGPAAHGSVVINADNTLTYTPAGDYFGPDSFTYTVNDGNGGTSTATVNLDVTAVNDAPSFTAGSDQTVDEDAGAVSVPGWATEIFAGPGELSQALDFIVTNDNNALFEVQPSIAADGTLTFKANADANGVATITVKLKDNGGGNDTSGEQTFKINITPVNDPPTFTAGDDVTIDEDAGEQSIAFWAKNITAGPADEASQQLEFIVASDKPELFEVQPSISADGTLSFKATTDANGVATITVKLKDDGGGSDTSAEQTFKINITPVNDDPTFTAGGDQNVQEDAGAQSVAWASDISAGPANESGQLLTFVVTNDNNALFASQPAIDPSTGLLTYTPAANASGSATVSVTLNDDAGGTSTTRTFAITVNAVADAPSLTVSPASGNESSPIALVINPALLDTDGSESLSIKITGVPTTASLSAGINNGSGSWTLTPAQLVGLTLTNPDNANLNLGVQAIATESSNGSSAMTMAMLPVTVKNLKPTATVNALTEVVRGQTVVYSLTANDASTADRAAGFKYIINWGDGSPIQTILPTANNGAGLTTTHVFTSTGNYNVTVTATDKDNLASTAVTRAIKVSAVAMETDPMDPTKKALFIGGTTGLDLITILDAHSSKVLVKLGLFSLGTFTAPSQIIVFAQAGDDLVTVEGSLKIPAQIYGGDGNDALIAGGGTTFLFGEAGNDIITGGSGRSILIGGKGTDRLVGASGDDILIAGTSSYDAFPANQAALKAIRDAWNSTASYATRTTQLTTGVGSGNVYKLNSSTLFNDNAYDQLTGSSGDDWFISNNGDKLTDRKSNELLKLI